MISFAETKFFAGQLRQSIQKAETSNLKGKGAGKLKSLAPSLEKTARVSKNTTDSARLQVLDEILQRPVM